MMRRHLLLPDKDRLPRAGMLVAVSVGRLDEGKAGQRVVLNIAEVLLERGDVVGVDAECIAVIADGLLDPTVGAVHGSCSDSRRGTWSSRRSQRRS